MTYGVIILFLLVSLMLFGKRALNGIKIKVTSREKIAYE